jgi:L,D-peptidoglycan transpeptidase YkuD (ErfK/YbiS/YcfS/YnhG family)
MIIINNSNYLKYKNLKFRCGIGKAGIGIKKTEGDNITPRGTYKIVKIYYRKDRIKNIVSKFTLFEIKKNMGWCDDPKSKNYNKLISLPCNFSHEKLYRKDNLYDLILVLNYNFKPIVKNKGSAIFIHIQKNNFKKTKGCISLKKKDLLKITSLINKNTKVKII